MLGTELYRRDSSVGPNARNRATLYEWRQMMTKSFRHLTTGLDEVDAWFRREVENAVREADDPNVQWHSQAEVKRQSQIKQAAWRDRSVSSEPP